MSRAEPLRQQIDVIEWEPLWHHYAFDRVRLVGGGIPLERAAVAVAEDDADQVRGWLEAGDLSRPSDDQVRRWVDAKTLFEMVVVRPFVLIRVLDN